jgi:hypothetical protein
MGTDEWLQKFTETHQAITDYLVGYYNQHRPHKYNGESTPNESERQFWLTHKTITSSLDHYRVSLYFSRHQTGFIRVNPI